MHAMVHLSPLAIRCSLATFLLLPAPAFADEQLTPEQAAIAMAEAPSIRGVALSPDGKWVTYTVTRRSVEKNTPETERYLQRIPQDGEGVEEDEHMEFPEGAAGFQWRPDSKCLSMILSGSAYEHGRETPKGNARFACYEIATGETKTIPVNGRAVTANYKWSPTGNYVAFLAPLAERAPLDERRGVPHGLVEPGRFWALFVLNVKTGAVEQLTTDEVNVARAPHANFAWSPDETALAVVLDREAKSYGFNSELVVIDRRSRKMRPLAARPGMNGCPCWSPDGRLIAFATHQGDRAYRLGWPALVPAKGGRVSDFPKDSAMGFSSCRWSADGRAFHYVSSLGMTHHLVRADAAARRTEPLPQASDLPLAFEDNRSFSADGRMMAFTRESLTTPPDLFAVSLGQDGEPESVPIQLTNLAPDFALGRNVRVEETSWPSRDGKFTIHGLLLTPASAGGKLPTVLYFMGGPSMVRRGFFVWSLGAYLPLAASGYAVLIPNTRGRGGYGAEFNDAIAAGKSRGRLPLDDALAGLDLLVDRKIADPKRMGVHGFSYGGYLTAYTVTRTNRFKAAVIQDGGPFSLLSELTIGVNDGFYRLLFRDLFGIHDPFDPAERARLIEESPILHADRVRTPTLLLAAAKHGPFGPYDASMPTAWAYDGPFYHALRRHDVPAALLVYDEGHVFQRPAAIADSHTRTVEWIDYWVRDIPFPDPVRAKEYGVKEWGRK